MPTAVAYARFSSDRQHESSIEAQRAAITTYAERHGITIIELYADRGISGTTDKRPEFLRLLSDLKYRPVDFVLVHKYDRFSRSRYDAAVYSRLIQQRGARLVAVAQDFGAGPEAVIMEALMQAWAEYYSLNLSTEVIKGRKVTIKKGRHPGGQYPFGYEPDGNGGYRIVELEAYYVRRLYQAVIDGTPSLRSITREMREDGIRGRRGSYLTAGNVAAMLKSPIYAGIYDQQAGGEHSRIEGNHPAIVPIEIYKEAVRLIESRSNTGRAPRREFLLTGIVRCVCGAPMYGHSNTRNGKTYISYVCHKACGNRAIRAAELDEATCSYVRRILSPEVREQLTDALAAYMVGQRRHAERSAASCKREIARLRSEIDALTANLSAGVLPPSVVETIGKQIAERETQIDVLSAMSTPPPEVDAPSILAYFADVSEVSPSMPVAELRPIIRRFVSSITVHPTAIEFTSTFDAWLREHFPQLAAPTFPPQGPDDPKGGGSSTPPVSPAPSSTPSNPAAPPSSSCTASDASTVSKPHALLSGTNQFGDIVSSSVSKPHTPARSNKQFGDAQILFVPYIVKREPRPCISGIVARRMIDMFMQIDDRANKSSDN